MTLNEEIKESIKVVEWLRQELQHTPQFNTGIKAQWVMQLNDIINILRAEDYVEGEVLPVKEVKPKTKMKGISLKDLKGNVE